MLCSVILSMNNSCAVFPSPSNKCTIWLPSTCIKGYRFDFWLDLIRSFSHFGSPWDLEVKPWDLRWHQNRECYNENPQWKWPFLKIIWFKIRRSALVLYISLVVISYLTSIPILDLDSSIWPNHINFICFEYNNIFFQFCKYLFT